MAGKKKKKGLVENSVHPRPQTTRKYFLKRALIATEGSGQSNRAWPRRGLCDVTHGCRRWGQTGPQSKIYFQLLTIESGAV